MTTPSTTPNTLASAGDTGSQKQGLTRRQRECLTVIQELIRTGDGVAPATTDVAARLKIHPSSAQRLMRQLCRRGHAKWQRFGTRAFQLL